MLNIQVQILQLEWNIHILLLQFMCLFYVQLTTENYHQCDGRQWGWSDGYRRYGLDNNVFDGINSINPAILHDHVTRDYCPLSLAEKEFAQIYIFFSHYILQLCNFFFGLRWQRQYVVLGLEKWSQFPASPNNCATWYAYLSALGCLLWCYLVLP